MKSIYIIVIINFLFFLPFPAKSLLNFQSTMSSGIWKNIEKKYHTNIFYNLSLNYTHNSSGIETYLDLSFNNFIKEELNKEWALFPYQMLITIPFDHGFDGLNHYVSRIQIGRQLLVEGFELELLDGMYAPYYFSKDFAIIPFAGGLVEPNFTSSKFEETIYGASFLYKNWDSLFKITPIAKNNKNDIQRKLTVFSFQTNYFKELPLNPQLLFKKQFDIKDDEINQDFIEVTLSGKKTFSSIYYSSRFPDPLFLEKKNYIYHLYAINHQDSLGATINYELNSNVQLNGKWEVSVYENKYEKNRGEIQEISSDFFINKTQVNTFLTRITSFGGTMWDLGCTLKHPWNEETLLRFDGDILKLEKIHRRKGWGYLAKTGIDMKIKSNWRALFTLELIRNHIFDMDSRAAIYITHFYY